MATLTGKITDVTGRAPDSISSITVKAPSVRVGGGTDLIVSSPATVDFDRDTGDVTISGLTGGLSWLCLEGEGWSDSIALSVAEGMISLVEAIANASSAPGIIDYLRLLAEFKIRFDDIAQDAVDAAATQYVGAKNLETQHLDDVRTPGRYTQPLVANVTAENGYPVASERVNLFVVPMHETASSQVMQYLVVRNTGDIYIRDYVGGWGEWSKSNSGVLNLGTTHLDDALTPGYYAQPLAGNVTKDKGYPVEGTRVTLNVERIHGTIASQVVQTVNSIRTGETFVRTIISGNYSEWSEVGGGSFYRGAIPSSITSIDELAPGNWGCGNANIASALGLPESFGALLVMYITGGKTFLYQAQENTNQDGALWICSQRGSGEFSSWKKIGGGNGGGVESSTLDGDLFTLDADELNVEFVAPEQPADTTFINASSSDVHGMYDQLMADNPDYITRSQIGTSSDGTSPIYAYAFKRPEVPGGNDGNPDPTQSRDLPLGVIFSATHGHESASVANIYRFAKMLCEDWRDHPALDVIRWNCEVIIVPMVNAYGWDGRGNVNVWSRKNANEVDINRNFPRGWVRTTPGTATWSGEEPLSEPESQAIWGLLNEVKDRAVFGIDSHNFSSNENSKWRQIWEIYSHPMTMEVAKAIVQLMSRRWKERYTWIDVPESYYGYVQVGAGGTLAQGMAELGIPGSTLETNNLTFLDNSGVDYSSRAMTLGLDTIVNHIRLAFREGIRRKAGVSD